MLAARRVVVSLVTIWALVCGTVTFAQSSAKPPAKTPAKTTAPPPRPAKAPTRSDPFIGVWQLNAEKSKYESGGAPKGFTRTYEDRGNGTIFMTTDVVGAGNATTRSYLVYRRDGKPYPEAGIGVESIRLVTVKAIDHHTEELTFNTGDKPANATTITVSVSADGRTMTQVLSGKTAQSAVAARKAERRA